MKLFDSAFIRRSFGKAAVVSALAALALSPVVAQAAPRGAAPAGSGARENIYGRVSAVHGNDIEIRDSRGFVSRVRVGDGALARGFALRPGVGVRIYGYNSGPYFAASLVAPYAIGYGYGGPAYAYGYGPCYGYPYAYGCAPYYGYGPYVSVGFGYYGGWRGGYYGGRGGYYGGRGGYSGGGWHGGGGGGWHGGGGGGWHGRGR